MHSHIEIQIRLNLNKGETLHDVLRQFVYASNDWIFPQEESEEYQKHTGNASGYVICDSPKEIKPALVAITTANSKQPNIFYVANIVPRDCFELKINEYNAIGSAFARDFENWCRKNENNGKVRCSNPKKTLAHIIPGEKSRMFFERYLNSSIWDSSALPAHPSDIEKLDVFICALFRYGSNVSTHEIERFLVSDEKWKQEDAAWVRNRIDTGLDVLKLDRRF